MASYMVLLHGLWIRNVPKLPIIIEVSISKHSAKQTGRHYHTVTIRADVKENELQFNNSKATNLLKIIEF